MTTGEAEGAAGEFAPGRISIAYGAASGARGFELWADMLGPVFDVDATRDQVRDFKFAFDGWDLGTVIFGRCRSQGHTFVRSERTIARTGVDHVVLQLTDEGGVAGVAGRKDLTAEPGDICVYDLSRGVRTVSPDFGNTNIVIPRSQLTPFVADHDSLHGLVMPSSQPRARLLAQHLRSLAEALPSMSPADARAMAEPTIHLVGACLGPSAEGRAAVARGVDHVKLRMVRLHIDRHLGDPGLDADRICRDCGVSRSGLYRLFEPLGGVAAHIRSRRLSRAFQDLVSPRHSTTRISEIGYRWGFTSESSFSRAFRDAFGQSPSEARSTAASRIRLYLREGRSTVEIGSALTHWMQALMRV